MEKDGRKLTDISIAKFLAQLTDFLHFQQMNLKHLDTVHDECVEVSFTRFQGIPFSEEIINDLELDSLTDLAKHAIAH